MNKDQHTHELIDLYLQGELMGEDLDLFKIRLREDEKFLRQVQLQKAIIEHVRDAREADLRKIFDKKKKKKRGAIIPFNRRVLAVAAVLLSITALGMILKMFLPLEQLSSSDSASEPETEITEGIEDTAGEIAQDSAVEMHDAVAAGDSAMEETVPMLAEVEDEEVAENAVLDVDQPEDDLSRLRESEDLIDGKDIEAKKDELITTRTLRSMNIALTAVVERSADSGITVAETTSTEKKKRPWNRKEDKLEAAPDSDEVDEVKTTRTETFGKEIKVEYWRSIVDFAGYSFDGTTLKLYKVPPDARLKVMFYQGNAYLKWDRTIYSIQQTNKYKSFQKLTDQTVLDVVGP